MRRIALIVTIASALAPTASAATTPTTWGGYTQAQAITAAEQFATWVIGWGGDTIRQDAAHGLVSATQAHCGATQTWQVVAQHWLGPIFVAKGFPFAASDACYAAHLNRG